MNIRKCIYLFVSAAVLAGCMERRSVETGPEERVTAFNEAMATGQFSEAAALCDTALMADYLRFYTAEWEKAMKTDSSIAAAANAILSGISTDVVSVEKDGNKRTVRYTVSISGYSSAKARKAVLRKEEGEWKIETVTEDN